MKIIKIMPFPLFFAFALFFITGCGGTSQEKAEEDKDGNLNIKIETEDGKEEISVNLDNLEESIEQLTGDEKVEVVDFRKLKSFLPGKLAGIKRTSIEGQKSGFAGINISTVEAIYEEDNKEFDVTIIDSGGIGMVLMGMAAWATVEIDKETEHGYERTTTIDGNKAIEKYDSKTEDGEIAVIIKDRLIVTINGQNISERELQKARKALDINGLEKLLRK